MTEEPKRKIIRKIKKIETDSQVKCDVTDCKEECNHRELHSKKELACDFPCGVHSEAKCV